jgi:hypothetical protein
MEFPLNLKAIGYGFATFVGGSLAMSIVGTGILAIDPSPIGKGGWSFLSLLGYFVPVVAGFVAAYFAPFKRILHGTIGGSIGILLLLAPAFLIPQYPLAGIPIVIAWYVALASLGAIFGNYRRNKVDP